MKSALVLPEVTLVLIETREHELARLALEDCQARAMFGDVLVFTDRPDYFADAGRRIIQVPDWPDKMGWARHMWQSVAPHVRTSHMLCIQWDSWIIDPASWRGEFMSYDYIGSPWWYTDGRNVGNSGFCLRSTALMRYLRAHRDVLPCTTSAEDDLLCRRYRLALEDRGFTWAPEGVARLFAFECVRPEPYAPTFGFHGIGNWHMVLEPDALLHRARVAAASKYITNTPHLWPAFCRSNPDIVAQLARVS